jgi:hypothetical protein
LFRYLRDYLFFSIGFLGDFYVEIIRRRKGERNAALFAVHLRISRQAIRDPDWKSSALIRMRETQWNGFKHPTR